MSKGLYIDARQLQKGAKGFERLIKEMPDRVSDVLNSNAKTIVRVAKRNAPADRGELAGGISFTNTKPLQKIITSKAIYSAYIEFGTGKHAAQYVSTLPPDYQTFAAQFKGGGGGGFEEFLKLIKEWILRKGIVASFNINTRKRVGTGKSKSEQKRAEQMAYVIARSILIKGVHPHPFLIPALIDQQPEIAKDMVKLLNKLKL